jgi:hypothetical protein
MNDYNREQSEAIQMVFHYLKKASRSEPTRLKRRIGNYLQFREEADRFLQHHFSEVCTQKCYQDHYSACCNREGITTFFADVVINALISSEEEIVRLLSVLHDPNLGPKCVYLGKTGCLWRLKPIVCEMFLCEHAKESVFKKDQDVLRQWERLRVREKRYTWPDRRVLFDDLETHFIGEGYSSTLMYFHNSPGLLRVKAMAREKKQRVSQRVK